MPISSDFVSELRKHFTGDIRLDLPSRILYSTDASIYQVEPLGVAIPRNQEDLISAAELAARYRVPVLPRGSGSSLAGQAIGPALILDCSRYLDRLPMGINFEEGSATVEPGVILAKLNQEAAKYGLMFGPDPASAERATMGGVISNNATGAHSIQYGMTADHILAANVILSDGSLETWGAFEPDSNHPIGRQAEILNVIGSIQNEYAVDIRDNWPKTWRNSAGYRLNYLLPWSATHPPHWTGAYPQTPINLAALLAGSEGTLAIIRSAKVRLVPKPKFTILGVLSYPSLAAACDAVPELLTMGPSAVELIPQLLIRLARNVPAYAGHLRFVRGDPAALLVVEFSGAEINLLRERVKSLGPDVVIAESSEDQVSIWTVRKVGLGIFDSQSAEARPVAFIEDCAIPVENLGGFVRKVEEILADHQTQAAFYAHASAGCLHIRPIINLKTAKGVGDLRVIAERVLALTLQLGGSMSSEHGDGLARSGFLKQIYGDRIMEGMRRLKQAADPDNLFNPGNLFDTKPMVTQLRFGPGYQTRPWNPQIDFGRSGGLAGAIEQCNGQGVCRKMDGVMCPSFQATREEANSTRGRANLLRALISIQQRGLKPEQVKAALDLCLACKGCKAECPSNTDMAKLKYEFQAHYYQDHSRPARDYLFGYIGTFARLGAPLSSLVNALTRLPASRKLAQSLLGISAKRAFPKYGHKAATRSVPSGAGMYQEECLVLPDTFTHYFEPEVEAAALKVLASCGVKARTLPVFGAGRTLISKGFIEPARRHLEGLLDKIRQIDPTATQPVIGLEPSELYTLRDELADLLPNRRAEVEALSARSWLVDEYLVRPNLASGKLRIANLKIKNDALKSTKILLHGHCYQKAQPPHADGYPVGLNASVRMLTMSGFEVEVLNTGCCGMAGAFGYENDHYELSMQVAEMNLFPLIREKYHPGQGYLSATGTSCRSQISDGTGLEAQHSIELVARLLNA